MSTHEPPAPEQQSGRHPVNVGHLVMGLAFLGLVAVWAIVQSDAVDDDDIRWLLPLPWVLAGAAGLVATAFSARRSSARRTGWVAGDAPGEPTEAQAAPAEEPRPESEERA